MFSKKPNSNQFKALMPGIKMMTMVHGDNTSLTEFHLDSGTVLPIHKHLHEQTGYCLEGKMTLIIGDQRNETGPGDSWCIPANVKHGAEVLESVKAIEVFSPVRDEYL
jgi:quercetin dioxygenase-like cupin family protein